MSCLMFDDEAVAGLIPNDDSGWLTTTAVNGNTVYYRKIRNQVWVRRGSIGTSSANTLTTIATLPSGYRPIANLQFAILSSSSDHGDVVVKADGTVQSKCTYANTIPAFYVTFLID